MTPHDIDSLAGFRAAVCAAAADAVLQRSRRLLLVDPNFQDWPLEEPALLDALAAFVRLPDRRVVLLGRRFDGVARTCPRFVVWRQTWGHAVDACRPVDDAVQLPTILLVDKRVAVRVIDPVHWRGRVLVTEPGVALLADELDAFVQRSEPTFGASTLGL